MAARLTARLLLDAQSELLRVADAVPVDARNSATAGLMDEVPPFQEGAWPSGTTLGYLIARDVAHLFAHASELNVISTAAGGTDIGLPGAMPHASSKGVIG